MPGETRCPAVLVVNELRGLNLDPDVQADVTTAHDLLDDWVPVFQAWSTDDDFESDGTDEHARACSLAFKAWRDTLP